MSLASWEAEFYPVRADRVTAADALDHSIRKWEGLQAANLEKHGLRWDDCTAITDSAGESLAIGSHNCALCVHFEDRDCAECPLALARRGSPCTCASSRLGEGISPWASWSRKGDAGPMLVQLRRAREVKP